MGEYIWTTVRCKTPPGWARSEDSVWGPQPEFDAGVILDAYLGDRDVYSEHPEQEGTALVWSWNGEANYGLNADDLEEARDWLTAHRVPYVAFSESKYDIDGELEFFDGTNEPIQREHASDVVLSRYRYHDIIKRWEHAPVGALHAIAEHFTPIDYFLTDCDISHLPTFLPPDPDELVSAGFDMYEESQ